MSVSWVHRACFPKTESLGLQADFIKGIIQSKVNDNKLQFQFLFSVLELGSWAGCVHALGGGSEGLDPWSQPK